MSTQLLGTSVLVPRHILVETANVSLARLAANSVTRVNRQGVMVIYR